MNWNKIVIYGPTISNSQLIDKVTNQLKKYGGIWRKKKELLVVTDKLDWDKQSAAEYVILNADSPQLSQLTSSIYLQPNVIYYSQYKNNLLIYSRWKQNQPVIYQQNNNLVLFEGTEELPLAAVNELEGTDVSAALFAIAAGFTAGLPYYLIRRLVKELTF